MKLFHKFLKISIKNNYFNFDEELFQEGSDEE